MIRSLHGTVESTSITHLVLNVNGVGYLIYMNAFKAGYDVGDTLHLHTYLAVRETALDLYGFPTAHELEFFQLLLTIPKIGPKSALQILSQAEISILTEAIRMKDATMLHKLSGIGKKTAENIVQFLHDKLEHVATPLDPQDRMQSDAIDVLISLGYSPTDARSAVRAVATHTDTTDLVKQALRQLAN
ncbi:Holliday junction branch migration protein RuvA [Patescibacteria group bacterium]|nr:Holliday junction branch migration protein RuvA [Patescibacteria group bacterium]